MKYLKSNIEIEKFFEKNPNGSLLLLDYDGTLSPLVEERTRAFPYPGVSERIHRIYKNGNTRIVIISGRSLDDLEKLVSEMPSIELWGSHGLERKLPDGTKVKIKTDELLAKGLEEASKICQSHTGLKYCEIKPYSVALHWRGLNEQEVEELKTKFLKLWAPFTKKYKLEIHPFNGGLELRPKGHTKGQVVEKLLEEVPANITLAYLGDDATDEDAFEAIGNKGLKVLVREELTETLADIYIKPPDELLSFLEKWSQAHV